MNVWSTFWLLRIFHQFRVPLSPSDCHQNWDVGWPPKKSIYIGKSSPQWGQGQVGSQRLRWRSAARRIAVPAHVGLARGRWSVSGRGSVIPSMCRVVMPRAGRAFNKVKKSSINSSLSHLGKIKCNYCCCDESGHGLWMCHVNLWPGRELRGGPNALQEEQHLQVDGFREVSLVRKAGIMPFYGHW